MAFSIKKSLFIIYKYNNHFQILLKAFWRLSTTLFLIWKEGGDPTQPYVQGTRGKDKKRTSIVS